MYGNNGGETIFRAKWRSVQRAVEFFCDRRLHLRRDHPDRQDLMQAAALTLWGTCIRPDASPDRISANLVAKRTVGQWLREQKRNPAARPWGGKDAGVLQDKPARPDVPTMRIGRRATVSLLDAVLDHPELVQLWRNGVSTKEAAQQLGVTRQAVIARAAALGGFKFGSRWRFPADVGQRWTPDPPRLLAG